MGVLRTRALLFGVYIRAPDVWKLSYMDVLLESGLGGSCLKLRTVRATLLRAALRSVLQEFKGLLLLRFHGVAALHFQGLQVYG